jgi:predicted MFS family arabinose efflux permease
MSNRPAAAEPDTAGWGSSALRRATLTLAISQLVSWGVLFYGFAVVASDITDETGWSEGLVSGAFSIGLLIAGLGAPPVARALARHDPRLILTAGSIIGIMGMVAFAAAPNPVVLYAAWAVIGVAMAATLYEPAMAVLVALDPGRRHRTIAAVTVAGGLASTVFAPLGAALADALGWRQALAVLGIGGGVLTAVLHAVVLPAAHAHDATTQVTHEPAPPVDRRQRQLRSAVLFEQAAMIATTAYLIGLLVDRDVPLGTASAALGVMGLGKVAGRLLLLGPIGRRSTTSLAAAASAIQAVGLAVPLAITTGAVLYPAMVLAGAASGATTVLRPLIVVELVGAGPFAATNARIQRATTLTRAASPLLLGVAVTTLGWTAAWTACLVAFAVAGERYLALGRGHNPTTVNRTPIAIEPT